MKAIYRSVLAAVAAGALSSALNAATVIPPSAKADASSFDKTKPGFTFRLVHTSTGQPNAIVAAEQQLAGTRLVDPLDPASGIVDNDVTPGPNADGSYNESKVINYDQDATDDLTAAHNGHFTGASFPDVLFPGLDTAGGNDNLAGEVLTFIELPAGEVNLIVNSDDGFRLKIGDRYIPTVSATDTTSFFISEFDGGRGASDSSGIFTVTEAGVYPLRLIWFEGGGGANLELYARGASDILVNDVGGLKAYRPTGTALIAKDPTAAHVAVGATAAFTVSANGTGAKIQWQTKAPGKADFSDVSGATSATYTTAAQVAANDGTLVRAVVTVGTKSLASHAATLTVDTAAPDFGKVVATDLSTVVVTFSEDVDASAEAKTAYTLTGGVTVSAVTRSSANKVVLKTSALTESTSYTLTAKGIKDLYNNTAASITTPFRSPSLIKGVANYERWENNTESFLDFVANTLDKKAPTFAGIVNLFQAPTDVADNYGGRVSALFIAPKTGDYVFFSSSDDNGGIWLSTDESPANKHRITAEPQWNGTQSWNTKDRRDADNPENRSDKYQATEWPTGNTITLQAGKKYYVEEVWKEGGGGDNGGATYKLAGDADPADGTTLMKGDTIAALVLAPTKLSITTEPTDIATSSYEQVAFTVGATADGAIAPSYQWRRGGVAIAGATGASLGFIAGIADNGASFDCVVSINGTTLTATSKAAKLSVSPAKFVAGTIKQEFFKDAGRVQVETGGVGKATKVEFWDTFQSAAQVDDNYTRRVSGAFIPPTDGNYVFYISADDDADLFLSTDDTVANKKLIAAEPTWNDPKKWVIADRRDATHPENRSDQYQGTQWPTKNADGGATIALKKGNKYYIEAVQHEGGGGDNVGVNFKLAADADPADGDDTLMVAATIGHWEPGAVVTGPTIAIGADGKITFTGALTGSDNAAGPFTPVTGATSPFTPNTGAAAQKFYRSSN